MGKHRTGALGRHRVRVGHSSCSHRKWRTGEGVHGRGTGGAVGVALGLCGCSDGRGLAGVGGVAPGGLCQPIPRLVVGQRGKAGGAAHRVAPGGRDVGHVGELVG